MTRVEGCPWPDDDAATLMALPHTEIPGMVRPWPERLKALFSKDTFVSCLLNPPVCDPSVSASYCHCAGNTFNDNATC